MRKYVLLINLLFSPALMLYGMKHFVLISAPGSGKGTFSQYIVNKYGYNQVCLGDIFRNEIALHTPLGKQIAPIVKKGDYVDKKIVCELVEQYIGNILQANRTFILDGFPRAESSYIFLNTLLKKYNITNNVCFIQFIAKDCTCIQRITNRRVCTKCFTVYNKIFHQGDTCNKCNSKLSQRSADTKVIAKKRLQYFHKHIEPLMNRAKEDNYDTKKISTERPFNILKETYDQFFTS